MSTDIDRNAYLRNSFRILILAYYFLHRVALTKVHGSSEYFAFEVFESLNTSGETLNAYETLKPLVIKDLDLNYNTSPIKQTIDAIDKICFFILFFVFRLIICFFIIICNCCM